MHPIKNYQKELQYYKERFAIETAQEILSLLSNRSLLNRLRGRMPLSEERARKIAAKNILEKKLEEKETPGHNL